MQPVLSLMDRFGISSNSSRCAGAFANSSSQTEPLTRFGWFGVARGDDHLRQKVDRRFQRITFASAMAFCC